MVAYAINRKRLDSGAGLWQGEGILRWKGKIMLITIDSTEIDIYPGPESHPGIPGRPVLSMLFPGDFITMTPCEAESLAAVLVAMAQHARWDKPTE